MLIRVVAVNETGSNCHFTAREPGPDDTGGAEAASGGRSIPGTSGCTAQKKLAGSLEIFSFHAAPVLPDGAGIPLPAREKP
ncbi:MAG: hypothetical protein ACLP8B_22755 [Xanthobacteraceae bacterium]